MSKLEKYTSYKDSGVEWLGNIPTHWEVTKLKFLSNVYNGATPSSGIEKFWNGNISWVTPTDFNKSNYISQTERKITKSGLNSCGTTLVPKNSIIMTTRAPIGNIAIAENELCTNQGCKSIVIDKKTDEKYMFYQFFTKTTLLNSLGSGTTFMELSSKELKNIKLPLPPKEEQTKIASFLDEKTAQIDSVISQKEKLIELLKEQKQITINEAVTKGLDKDVEFKDSGVEWIGAIPKHWEVEKGKRLFKQMKRTVREQDEIVTCFRDGIVTLRSNRRTEGFTNALKEHGYQGIRKGDFIIHNMDAFAGAIGISDSDGKSTPVYAVCRPWDENLVSSEYYARYLRNLALQDFILSLAKGIRERSTDFRFKDFGELVYPVPPKNEQTEIVEYIEKQTAKIDKAIELQQNYIGKLKEYKASLIDSVVTGKVRVA